MAVTRLKRKDRKNKARANNRVARINQLLAVPVIKNVDRDELIAQFGKNKGTAAETAPKAEKPAAEAPARKEKAAPKAEAPAADAAAMVEEHNRAEDKAAEPIADATEPDTAIGSEDKA